MARANTSIASNMRFVLELFGDTGIPSTAAERIQEESAAAASVAPCRHLRVANITEALRILRAHRVDVVLFRGWTADAVGRRQITELRAAAPRVPMVVLIRSADPASAVEAIRAGAQDCIAIDEMRPGQLTRMLLCARERMRREHSLLSERVRLNVRVERATTQLESTNEALRDEVEGRQRVSGILHRAHAELEQIFQTAAGAMRLVDRNFIVFKANETMAKMLDATPAQIVGRPCYETFPGEFCDTPACTLRKVLAGEKVVDRQVVKWRLGHEDIPCLLNARILHDEHGEIIGMVEDFRDLREQLRLEAVAEAVNTMNSIGYVFAGIRHELGNPINAIKTTLAVLLRKLDAFGPNEVRAYVDRALGDISRVEFLLKSLRSYSMFESPRLEAVAIGPFFKNLLVLARDDFRRSDIEIRAVLDGEIRHVYADPRALQQVMLNLLANASDALRGRSLPRITIRTRRSSQGVELVVDDNGCGITERQQQDLFKPFFTNKPGGTGLGLVIVQKMLTRMGGTIVIESESGVGTRVVMTMKAEPDEPS